jgi:YidC/Oxa1 family membrane protein insertase
MVSMLLWQAWQEDYGKPPPPSTTTAAEQKETQTQVQTKEVPVTTSLAPPSEQSTPAIQSAVTQTKGSPIIVNTDLLRLEINARGGGIQKVELLAYPDKPDDSDAGYVLMDNTPDLLYATQGGLLSRQGAPTHEDKYVVSDYSITMTDGQETLLLPMTWTAEDGIKVTKVFEFTRGSYLIKIRYEIDNQSGKDWQGRSYLQIKRRAPNSGRRLIYTYTGAVFSSPEERYEKIDFDDMQDDKLEKNISNGWVAMLQHYFVTALVPADKEQTYQYYTNALANDIYLVGAITPARTITAASKGQIEEHIYIGPKIIKKLEKIAEGLELTVDYGVLWFIAKPLFGVLSKLHDYTNNWGWSIILVTILLKLIFFPLSAAGYKSMANMRRVQPRMLSIKERYKEDKAKLNQAMMQIYKEEKINPLGGCFPILVQIPVFIALYWVLLESVEMRQASFALWLQDLSSPDPYFVLPLVMGITMFIQQKLNPAPMDPVQAKVMQVLPVAFTVFFAFFPSGLVLYWVVNNILSIAQQWQITRSLERAGITNKS